MARDGTDKCGGELITQENDARGCDYLGAEEGLNGEELIGLLFHHSQVRHDVVVCDPGGGAQHVIDH